jgi:predicted alpha/beta superfamily hydrolase
MKHHSIKEFDVLKGNGKKYLKYLVEKLKPEIDKNYRTLTDANNTAIMGSSMGGVISNQAAGLYPDVFGRVGCVSNAFYVSYDSIIEFNKNTDFSKIKKFYMDVGDNEGGHGSRKEYLKTNNAVYDILRKKMDKNVLTYKIVKGGIHSERAWSKRFPSIIRILFK